MKNEYYLTINQEEAKQVRIALANRLSFLRKRIGSLQVSMRDMPRAAMEITMLNKVWEELDGTEATRAYGKNPTRDMRRLAGEIL